MKDRCAFRSRFRTRFISRCGGRTELWPFVTLLILIFGTIRNIDSALMATTPGDTVLWHREWNAGAYDLGNSLAVDSSGNIYVAGQTNSTGRGSFDVLLLKYDSSGNLLWNETWGGIFPDLATSVAVNAQDEAYLTGAYGFIYYNPYGVPTQGSEVLLLKVNSDGNESWAGWADLLSSNSGVAGGESLAVGTGGEVYVAGESLDSNQQFATFLIRVDSSGRQEWERIWGSNYRTFPPSVVVDPSTDDVYVVGGAWSYQYPEDGILLMKYNSTGGLLWEERIQGAWDELAHGLLVGKDGSVYLTGDVLSGLRQSNVLLLKLDSSGRILWQVRWGGINYDSGRGLALSKSDDLFVTGFTTSFTSGDPCIFSDNFTTTCPDVFLLELNSTESLRSQIVWGGRGDDVGAGVVSAADGSTFVAGYIGSSSYSLVVANSSLQSTTLTVASSNLTISSYNGLNSMTQIPLRPAVGNQQFTNGRAALLLKYGSATPSSTLPRNLSALIQGLVVITFGGLLTLGMAVLVYWRGRRKPAEAPPITPSTGVS